MKEAWVALFAALAVLAGCTSPSATPPQLASAPILDESVPPVARKACLAEVARVTANPTVTILEMIYSEANSQVKVGVGPDRAPWQCLVSNSGVVQNVMSLTNEGRL